MLIYTSAREVSHSCHTRKCRDIYRRITCVNVYRLIGKCLIYIMQGKAGIGKCTLYENLLCSFIRLIRKCPVYNYHPNEMQG